MKRRRLKEGPIEGKRRRGPDRAAVPLEVVERLQHEYLGVRTGALPKLVRIFGGGAVFWINVFLEHRVWFAREAAVQALSQIEDTGCVPAVRAVTARLADQDGRVRRAAVHALSQIVEKGDPMALLEVTRCMEHADKDVRKASLQALSLIAEKGDEQAIAAVSGRLDDVEGDIREAASFVLSQLKGSTGSVERHRGLGVPFQPYGLGVPFHPYGLFRRPRCTSIFTHVKSRRICSSPSEFMRI